MSVIKKENESAFIPVQNYKEEIARELTNEKSTSSESMKKKLLTKIPIP